MSLEKKESSGTIRLNDAAFAKLVIKAVSRADNKAFFASEKGKLLNGSNQKISTGDLIPHLKIWEEGENICLEFYIISQFGASISQLSQIILDYLVGELRIMFPNGKGQVVLHIVGVKSKKLAERNIRIVREYEPAR